MLDRLLTGTRLAAGIAGVCYLAWKDWPLALAVIATADALICFERRRPS